LIRIAVSKPASFAALIFLCAGCGVDSKETKQTVHEIGNDVEQLTKTIGDYINQTEAPAELKKLQQFEYRVETFPLDAPATLVEERLNDLGKDRWDCVYADRFETKEPKSAFVCKRRPDTPLRYVPKTFIGG